MCDDSPSDDLYSQPRSTPALELLTLGVLEDVAAVLDRHGVPPLRGYALAELAVSLYRLQTPHS